MRGCECTCQRQAHSSSSFESVILCSRSSYGHSWSATWVCVSSYCPGSPLWASIISSPSVRFGGRRTAPSRLRGLVVEEGIPRPPRSYIVMVLRPVFSTHQVGVSLVSNHLWETVALSRLLGDPPGDVRYPLGWTQQCGEWISSRFVTWTDHQSLDSLASVVSAWDVPHWESWWHKMIKKRQKVTKRRLFLSFTTVQQCFRKLWQK